MGHDSHFAQKFRSAKPVGCSTLGFSRQAQPVWPALRPAITASKRAGQRQTDVSILNSMTQNITIVGVGLIGGSFALALREAGYEARFVGVGRNEQSLQRAVELGIVDSTARHSRRR